MRKILLLSLQLLFFKVLFAQTINHQQRAAKLLNQLTLDEKVGQLLNASPAIPRLNIPEYNWWNECLHGVARSGTATVFPQPIGLAASFDRKLLQQIGDISSNEARIQHTRSVKDGYRGIYYGLTVWAPNINLFRDPRWGRGHETYGEDPYLTGELAKHFIWGLQGPNQSDLKVIATPKHFAVHSGPENRRHGFNAVVSGHDLNESYLPHFKKAITEGQAGSIMCAYNRINGAAACADGWLLGDLLRREWGFKGYIVSDCGAVEDIYLNHSKTLNETNAATSALKAGLDLECMVGVKPAFITLTEAVKSNLVKESAIDSAVTRLFVARSKLGMLQNSDKSGWANLPPHLTDCKVHREAALKAALESAVLLKNKNNILPLKKETKIALIGPHANSKEALWGNYHGVPSYTTSLAEGIMEEFGKTVAVSPGCLLVDGFPEFEIVPSTVLSNNGTPKAWKVKYYNSDSAVGKPAFERLQTGVNFSWSADTPPKDKVTATEYLAIWEGELTAPSAGLYNIGALTEGSFRLYVNGKLHCAEWPRKNSGLPIVAPLELKKGQKINIRWEYKRFEFSMAKLVWRKPGPNPDKYLEQAIKLAREADVIVLALGLSPNIEGEEMGLKLPGFESGDRSRLDLPASQKGLILALRKLNKPIVSVLINGGPLSDITLDTASSAILEMWYPGQEGGRATARLLVGKESPSGRMPVTAWQSVHDLPEFSDYSMAGRTYKYGKNKALYPFGFGLGYSKITYSDLNLPGNLSPDSVGIGVTVANNGKFTADEVVQIYASWPDKKTERPKHQLVYFERISLKPFSSEKMEFKFPKKNLAIFDEAGVGFFPQENLAISVGGGQPGFIPETSGLLVGKILNR